MKKMAFVLVLIAVIGLGFSHAQEKKVSLQTNPFIAIYNIAMGAIEKEYYVYFINMEFQYAVSNKFTLSLRPHFLIGNDYNFVYAIKGFFTSTYKDTVLLPDDYKDIMVSSMIGLIFRPGGKGLKGFYMGLYPNIGWENLKYEDTMLGHIDDSFLILGIGAELGYEWVFSKGFTISLGGGLERNFGIGLGEVKGNYTDPSFLYNLRLNFMMGYSF
jgi:hypothetical protein